MADTLPNSAVTYHPQGSVVVEVYDTKGRRLSIKNVYQTFSAVVVEICEEAQ